MAIQINLDTTNNNIDDLSFGLLRTNPALSTNAKLVVDSDGYIFMDAFLADSELVKTGYRKNPINPETGNYSVDVANFFGNLANNIKYKAGRVSSDFNVYTDYSYQYETQYNHGASFNNSKIYKEQYKFFAPIWLDKNMPSNFVIYRVKGTVYSENYAETIGGQNSRILELLRNATLVKSFDLTENSSIGKYLRNHLNNEKFPSTPLSQNFEMDQYSIFRGIDTVKGGFVEKKENLYNDFAQHDNLEIFSNEIFSGGFERNGVAVANLINLEFLFDDFKADNYDIYRYFGVYVTPHKEGYFDVDRVVNNDSREGIFVDAQSVVSTLDRTGTTLTHVDMLPKSSELQLPSLNWVKSRDGEYFHIRNSELFTENDFLPVSLNKSLDSEFKGATKVNTLQVEDFSINLRDFLVLDVVQTPSNGDKILLVPYTELKSSNFVTTEFTIAAENSLVAGTFTGNKFSINGSLIDIARALAGCLSQSEYGFKIKYNGTRIVLEDYAVGSTRKSTMFGIRKANVSDFLVVSDGLLEVPTNTTSTIVNNWDIYYPYGGAIENRAVLVKTENKGLVSIGDLVKSANVDSYTKISQIVKDPHSDMWRIIFEKEITLPKSKNINIYEKYQTSFGRFQIFDLKDFDFDFYDTSNSDLGELNTESYILTSRQYQIYNQSSNPDITIPQENYYANLLSVSTEDIIDRRSKVSSLSNSGEITSFISNITSEYNRLYENEIKETATLSRIVPKINKFVLKDGFNARMKPYHLSVNESFGVNNLSPNIEGDTRSPELLNMEHFHISKSPSFMLADTANIYKNSSYLDFGLGRTLSLGDLKSTSFNYFDKYFTWNGAYTEVAVLQEISRFEYSPGNFQTTFIFSGTLSSVAKTYAIGANILRIGANPANYNAVVTIAAGSNRMVTLGGPTSGSDVNALKIGDVVFRNLNASDEPTGTFVKNKRQKRYSKFANGNSTNQYPSTIFRGLRYVLKNRKESTLALPKEFIASPETNGYKFGFVVNYEVSTDNSTPTTKAISVVKNDKFKNICIYVNLTLQNNLVRALPRKVFYELENALDLNGDPVNTNITGTLSLNTASWNNFEFNNSGFTLIKGVGTKFKSQINLVDGQFTYLLSTVGGITRAFKVHQVIGDEAIVVQGWPRSGSIATPSTFETGPEWTTPASISNTIQESFVYKYYKGGKGAFVETLESLNAKRISDVFNNNPSEIEYITVQEDGTILNNQFILNVEDGTKIIKLSSLITEVDNDKPKSYKVTAEEIGKTIKVRDDQYFTVLKRMNGEYLPKFKDVVFFEEIYPSNIYYNLDNAGAPIKNKQTILYNKYNNMGVVFGSMYGQTGEDHYGYLKNYYFHKVNPESADAVLKLSTSSDKLPLYPKIGEIAIGKKDFNILKSKYEDDYYVKCLLNDKTETAFGTVNPVENTSFMASTVMKVDDIYTLSRFNATKVNSELELTDAKIKASRNNSIFWYENDSKVFIDVYLRFALLDELIEKGVNDKFNKYITPSKSFGDITTIEDDLVKYVDSNIVPRFIIDTVELYAKESKDISTNFISVVEVTDIDQTTYVKQSNFTYSTFAEDRLGFRLIYNKRPGYKYEFIPAIKIIA
jgi:hypothetical protein